MKQQDTGSQGLIFYSVKLHFSVLTQRSGVLHVFPSSVCPVAEIELESQSNHTFNHVLLIMSVVGMGLLYVSENYYMLKMTHEQSAFAQPSPSLVLHIYAF